MFKIYYVFVVLLTSSFYLPTFAIDECDPNKTFLGNKYKITLTNIDGNFIEDVVSIKINKSKTTRGGAGDFNVNPRRYVQFHTRARELKPLFFLIA